MTENKITMTEDSEQDHEGRRQSGVTWASMSFVSTDIWRVSAVSYIFL